MLQDKKSLTHVLPFQTAARQTLGQPPMVTCLVVICSEVKVNSEAIQH